MALSYRPSGEQNTPHPSLVILGYSEAAMFLESPLGASVVGITSIHGPRDFAVESSKLLRLDLLFDDADVPDQSDIISVLRASTRQRWSSENGLDDRPPTKADAAAIIEFAEKVRSLSGTILCHCTGGISRAPAAGLISLAVWRGAGMETECVAEMEGIRPGASPHLGLIRFADELLGRGGNLVNAVRAASEKP